MYYNFPEINNNNILLALRTLEIWKALQYNVKHYINYHVCNQESGSKIDPCGIKHFKIWMYSFYHLNAKVCDLITLLIITNYQRSEETNNQHKFDIIISAEYYRYSIKTNTTMNT